MCKIILKYIVAILKIVYYIFMSDRLGGAKCQRKKNRQVKSLLD